MNTPKLLLSVLWAFCVTTHAEEPPFDNFEALLKECQAFIEERTGKAFQQEPAWEFADTQKLATVFAAEFLDRPLMHQLSRKAYTKAYGKDVHTLEPEAFIQKYFGRFVSYKVKMAGQQASVAAQQAGSKYSLIFRRIYYIKEKLIEFHKQDPALFEYFVCHELVHPLQDQHYPIFKRHHLAGDQLEDNLCNLLMEGQANYLALEFLRSKGHEAYATKLLSRWKASRQNQSVILYRTGYELFKALYEAEAYVLIDKILEDPDFHVPNQSYLTDAKKLIEHVTSFYAEEPDVSE